MITGGSSRPPWWEWVIAGLGAVLVAGVLGYTAWQGLATGETPPSPALSVLSVRPQQDGRFLVLLRAANRGGSTAAKLRIEGELQRSGETVERSELVFDYLPAYSHRTGGLFFGQDPRAGELRLRAVGYVEP